MNHLCRLIFLFLAGFLFGKTGASAAPPTALLYSIFDPSTNAQAGVQQGYSIAVDGSVVVVGAHLDQFGGAASGVVKVYDASTGTLLRTLTNPTPAQSDWFGYSVAISGTRVAVGAPHDSDGVIRAGTVYVYDLSESAPISPWLTLTNPTPGDFDEFGCSVGISGTRLVVGARLDDTGATNGGSAYVFDLASALPNVPVETLTSPNPAAYDNFGLSVAISDLLVVVGAQYGDTGASNAGSAYVYDLAGAVPAKPVTILTNPTPAQDEYFGASVAISGTRVVVGAFGARNAYVYDIASTNPATPAVTLANPNPVLNDYFGHSVALSGALVIIGAPYDGIGGVSAGAVLVYDLASAFPTLPVRKVANPSPATGDRFGNAVAISGTLLSVGAPFDDTNATDSGSAYVYDLASATPGTPKASLNYPSPEFAHDFGHAVGVSGSCIVVGAWGDDLGKPGSGSAYVYDIASLTPNVPALILTNPTPWFNERFGFALAISGTRIIIGAPDDNTGASGAGSAYIYDLAAVEPGLPVATLNNPTPAQGDWFGESVGVSGTRVVVAARNDDTGIPNAGSVYVYDLTAAFPRVPAVTLTNPNPTTIDSFGSSFDYFGLSVAISGTHVAVGAPQTKVGTFYPGSVYVFDLSRPSPAVPINVLTNPNPRSSGFGKYLAMSGTRLVVGTGFSTYLYEFASAVPDMPVAIFSETNFLGKSLAISGSMIMVGGNQYGPLTPAFGAAYVYDVGSLMPTVPICIMSNPNPVYEGSSGSFGNSVSMDGSIFVVGDARAQTAIRDQGAAYVFSFAPTLSIVPGESGFASISWAPATPSTFLLEYADGPTATNWVTAPSGTMNPATVSTTNTARIYRLVQRGIAH